MAQTFRDEMAALRGMFPSWDVEVLQEMLEAHQGDMESTVDSLLSMDGQPPPAPAQAQRSPQRRPVAAPSSSPRGQPRRRVKLPDDFLCLPTDDFCDLSEQEERDAILARMMQDQIFRDEVLSSEEFSSHFHDRSARHSQSYPPEKTASEIASETYTAMSEKFTSMSESEWEMGVNCCVAMKSKMHEMYMRFQMRNDAPASRDPKSQRPLMEDDSDSSEDEDLNDNPDVRRRNMDQRHSHGSPRRLSPLNLSRRPNARAGAHSKKDD
ncbi:hypothetical protein P3T76_013980 [Phytophthora citrophthora]|uniref:CUE domain-containing protein n=1 Tax=Phytophthora citrophthora TaxID=4793 RepID=A0AAD9G256_9STRA|nr:hypothetical protein P3T76_013980 [Phytophthora citrophthora]